jgi:1-acyl-sn-glycerol-3-phosphate acyltransferase
MLKKLLYWFSKPLVCSYTGTALKMDIQRQEQLPPGPKILAVNHPSTADPLFIASILRTQSFILINHVLFQVPILGFYLRRSGHIPVVAGSGKKALESALKLLAKGHTIMIFPEGDLSPENGGFHRPRTGVARLALLSGAPVIPVGVSLQRERCRTVCTRVNGKEEYGRWYLRGPYHITIGRPLPFRGDVENHDYVHKVAEIVMHQIIEMARLSELRMTQSPSHMASAPSTL